MMVSLLLVGVSSARESARRTQCNNNLFQLSVAIQSHESTHRHFPRAGWTFHWMGLSDLGNGIEQPGGWIYNIMPQIEEYVRHRNAPSTIDLVSGNQGEFRRFITSPVPILKCPSKRDRDQVQIPAEVMMFGSFTQCCRTDYAMNAGSQPDIWLYDRGPTTLDESRTYDWPLRSFDGVARSRQSVTCSQILDGLSNTICIGEKRITRRSHGSVDNQPIWTGFGADTCRWFYFPPVQDNADGGLNGFGSAHLGLTPFLFCDGSIRDINNQVDEEVYHSLGTVDGGERISHE
jgi:hypothetical protein